MAKRWAVLFAILVAGAVALVPVRYYFLMSVKYRNFRVVDPAVMYRSGQMSPAGFETELLEHGIRTVVALREPRDEDKNLTDDPEARICAKIGVKHLILPPETWFSPSGGPAPIEGNLKAFLAIAGDAAQQPVLVHCFAGIHRTGGYVALYRMEFDGWTADEAIKEMKSMGTPRTTFDDEISNYLRAYPVGKLRLPR